METQNSRSFKPTIARPTHRTHELADQLFAHLVAYRGEVTRPAAEKIRSTATDVGAIAR